MLRKHGDLITGRNLSAQSENKCAWKSRTTLAAQKKLKNSGEAEQSIFRCEYNENNYRRIPERFAEFWGRRLQVGCNAAELLGPRCSVDFSRPKKKRTRHGCGSAVLR